jgi:hypothetical protein
MACAGETSFIKNDKMNNSGLKWYNLLMKFIDL